LTTAQLTKQLGAGDSFGREPACSDVRAAGPSRPFAAFGATRNVLWAALRGAGLQTPFVTYILLTFASGKSLFPIIYRMCRAPRDVDVSVRAADADADT